MTLETLTRRVYEHGSAYHARYYPDQGLPRKFASLWDGGQDTWLETVRYAVKLIEENAITVKKKRKK